MNLRAYLLFERNYISFNSDIPSSSRFSSSDKKREAQGLNKREERDGESRRENEITSMIKFEKKKGESPSLVKMTMIVREDSTPPVFNGNGKGDIE